MSSIVPLPHESQSQFAIRYHAALQQAMPDTDVRNAAMLRSWIQQRGKDDPLERYARRQFPKHVFARTGFVPVFEEHETVEGDEQTPVKYDRTALVDLVESCNARIRDVGSFAPISDGHTGKDQEPEILGYGGPFYLGMIGRERPRWAIFQREHHRLDRADVIKNKPHRSVEVWRAPTMRERFFAPIAALGATTPRLDLRPAAFYARTAGDEAVERYEGPVMGLPAANATYVPSLDGRKPRQEKYGTDGADQSQRGAMSAEELQQVVSAVLDGVNDLLQEQYGLTPKTPPSDADEVPDDKAEDIENQDLERNARSENDRAELKPPVTAPTGVSIPPDDDDAGINAVEPVRPPNPNQSDEDEIDELEQATAQRALRDQIAALKAENAQLKSQLGQSSEQAQESERREQYQRLREKGYQLDIDKELNFSRSFDADTFKTHLTRIAEHYQRIPLASQVPLLDVQRSPELQATGQTRATRQEKAEQYAREARSICLRDPSKNYPTVLAELKRLAGDS